MTDPNKRIEELIQIAKALQRDFHVNQPRFLLCHVDVNQVNPRYPTEISPDERNFLKTFNKEFVLKLLESWNEMRDALKHYAANGKEGVILSGVTIVSSGEIAVEALAKADKVFE